MNKKKSLDWLRLNRVSKNYRILSHLGDQKHSSQTIRVLRDITFSIAQGEFAALMGPSGCGKSTLLNLIAGIDRPTKGEIHLGDTCISSAPEATLIHTRREHLGVIYQFFHLLPTLTAKENVTLPLILQGNSSATATREARNILNRVNMDHRSNHLPSELSGGELQRIALARAIVHKPKLLLADEPTGNLDTQTGDELLAYIQSLKKDLGLTILLTTHSAEVAAQADRIINLRDGIVVGKEPSVEANEKPDSREMSS